MKKTWVLLVALLMLLGGMTALAEDESVWEFDAYNFSLDGYTGAGGDVVIPPVIGNCTVDIIGLNAFNASTGITSLTLPYTLRQIESGAISHCEGLTEIVMEEGVQIIGDNCFAGNDSVVEMTVPASVCYIGNDAFSYCNSLRRVTFLGECPVFAGMAFDWMPEEAQILVPDDQLEAYRAAFEKMDVRVDVQGSGINARTVDTACDPEAFTFDAEKGEITLYEGFDVRVDVPEMIDGVPVRSIGAGAFEDSMYLCYVTLPEGVERIEASAFSGCSRLVHVEMPSTLRYIGSQAFADLPAWGVTLPQGLEEIGSGAFERAMHLEGELMLPQGLKIIGERAFAQCGWLETVYIPETVEKIGENAFLDCGIQYVVFEGLRLPEMADNVFANCWNLADIDLHTRATKQEMLEMQAVMDGLGLSCRVWRAQNPQVEYMEDGLDVYENGVLLGYTGQQTHIRPWDADYEEITVTAVGDGAFKNNTVVEYFSVPYNDEFTTIGAEAFAGSCVRWVDLFDSVTTIKEDAFRDCVYLEELVIPESVTHVGSGALSGCTGLKKLTVLCDPMILPEDLLAGCGDELEVYGPAEATGEQLAYLTRVANKPWYLPVSRVGEPVSTLVQMPDAELPGEDFWYDSEYARLDSYDGYELNLVLPREIDGYALTMIGGSMMQRAAYGDNYEMELPVVSVVIPENYTQIAHYAFANCETLETVICYAPLDMLPDCAFQNCTALREVIFVNGVRGLGVQVFDNCPSLETVYLGAHTTDISEYAFLNGDGSISFEQSACITNPADMPDVAALLERVKREPMPEPTPEPAPEPAVPVGEEGLPFFGVWNGLEMIMDGESVKLADFGMNMPLILLPDGRMFTVDEEIDLSDPAILDGEEAPGWRVENGTAIGDGCVMTIMEDGKLMVDEDGAQLIFEFAHDLPESVSYAAAAGGDPAPEATPTPAVSQSVGEEGKAYCGLWLGEAIMVEGEEMALSDLGMSMLLLLQEDGKLFMSEDDSMDLSLVTEEDYMIWWMENGQACSEGVTFELLEDGRLCLEESGMQMIFAPGDMSLVTGELPAFAAAESDVEPESARETMQDGKMEVKYVCTQAEVDGYIMDASQLGGEYSLIFHEDGKADFVIVGSPMPAVSWERLDNGHFMIDFSGSKMEIVWTETGFEMNYFDTMLMQFVPEE